LERRAPSESWELGAIRAEEEKEKVVRKQKGEKRGGQPIEFKKYRAPKRVLNLNCEPDPFQKKCVFRPAEETGGFKPLGNGFVR
jgi:hypothetical protein